MGGFRFLLAFRSFHHLITLELLSPFPCPALCASGCADHEHRRHRSRCVYQSHGEMQINTTHVCRVSLARGVRGSWSKWLLYKHNRHVSHCFSYKGLDFKVVGFRVLDMFLHLRL